MKTKHYIKKKDDVIKDPHWAILTFTTHYVADYDPGDGSGYSNPHVEYVAYTDEEDWKTEIRLLEERRTPYSAMHVKPAVVSRQIDIS
jgi:hypothetical protein